MLICMCELMWKFAKVVLSDYVGLSENMIATAIVCQLEYTCICYIPMIYGCVK